MTFDSRNVSSLTPSTKPTVSIANGTSTSVIGEGSGNSSKELVHLPEMLHELRMNLWFCTKKFWTSNAEDCKSKTATR
ncbi:unnamed protein product [Prunus brigantina]